MKRFLLKLGKLDLDEGRFEQANRWIKELSFRSPLKEKTLTELEWFFLQLKEKDPLPTGLFMEFHRL